MKRAERSEFTEIKRSLKSHSLGQGTCLTIRTDGSPEFKKALDTLYTTLGFHPAAITTDPHRFDGKERIVYIFGRTWDDDNGEEHPWTELYTAAEKERLAAALG